MAEEEESALESHILVEPEPGLTYRAYLDERKAKLSLSEKQGLMLDQSLLTLSGGALGLTLTFLHDHGHVTVALLWVFGGLSLTMACLLATLLSLVMSQRAISDQLDALDAWCRAHFVRGHPSEKVVNRGPFVTVTLWLNRVAIGTFVSGAGAISWFVIKNI